MAGGCCGLVDLTYRETIFWKTPTIAQRLRPLEIEGEQRLSDRLRSGEDEPVQAV